MEASRCTGVSLHVWAWAISCLTITSHSSSSLYTITHRCYVGYQPTIGEQQGLGCAASDTCMDDDGSLRACAACEGSGYVERFGCDSLTKLCR